MTPDLRPIIPGSSVPRCACGAEEPCACVLYAHRLEADNRRLVTENVRWRLMLKQMENQPA